MSSPPARAQTRARIEAQLLDTLIEDQLRNTTLWHTQPEQVEAHPVIRADADVKALPRLTRNHHRANFELWHQEDRARDPASADSEIARVKHAIDAHNQRRNDLVEQIDELLFAAAGPQPATAPLHSETPGAMLDRLSILALKLFHTQEEIDRPSATEAHRVRNRDRLALLQAQHRDLRGCVLALWDDVLHGRRRFVLYRQLKMYNDPDLNPVLYRTAGS